MNRITCIWSLPALVFAVACGSISCRSKSEGKASPKEVRVYPQQELVIKVCEAMLMGKPDEAIYPSCDWPGKDEWIATRKTWTLPLEYLEYTIGPVEVRENETIDEATMVAVPCLSMTVKNRSTGEIRTHPVPGEKLIETIVQRTRTAEGLNWCIVREPARQTRLAAVWLHQPRKKVADSATIVLKKDVANKELVKQICSDAVVVSATRMPYGEWE